MSTKPEMESSVRDQIMSDPEAILDDQELMHALLTVKDQSMGGNVIDMRGLVMERLAERLHRLEKTHSQVLAAAYENVAGTDQVQRAVLQLMEPTSFEAFVASLKTEVADILRIDSVRLILESHGSSGDPRLKAMAPTLNVMPAGYVESYITRDRNLPLRQVTLRQVGSKEQDLYRGRKHYICSEACLVLDLGPGRLPGMLVLGSEDANQFTPQHGTNLLAFFTGAVERTIRKWLG